MEPKTTPASAEESIARSKRWLSDDVFPLWTGRGVDPRDGGFLEALSLDGRPLELPRRAMVQARQIFAFRTGRDMGCLPAGAADSIIGRAAEFLVARYSLPSGAFLHAVDAKGAPAVDRLDLYTQAFVLFGLANAYAVTRDARLKSRALALADYLRKERRAPAGGFTELENGRAVLRSNPHMHLFEAALSWMELDGDPRWKETADEILALCLGKFIDPRGRMLGEIFADDWSLQRTEGRFFFEPGHQYEWAWLLLLYEEMTGRDLSAAREGLFAAGETWGLSAARNALDEVWNDGAPKKISSRFWPQTERVKAAVRLGARARGEERAKYFRAADEAVAALFGYLETPTPGLWRDTLLETGQFREEPAKASSLYHIINAFSEYAAFRTVSARAAGE